MVKRSVSLLLAAWLLSTAVAAEVGRDPDEYFFDQTLGDFTEELATARQEGKTGILIMFEMYECPFCHRMKTTVLNQPAVQDWYKQHFLIFPVDIESDAEITDFQDRDTTMKAFAFEQFRVRATPVFAFFDLEGRPIKRARYTGATRDAEEFLLLGRYVVDREYERRTFTRYKRERRAAAAGR